jgi:hypothetical protein
MRSNCIGLHLDMRKIKEFRRRGHGDLEWFMHDSRKMCSVLWKDKMHVLLLSTHAPLITPGNPRDCMVPRQMVQEGPTFLHQGSFFGVRIHFLASEGGSSINRPTRVNPSVFCNQEKRTLSYIPCASGIHQEHEGGGCCKSHSRELHLPSADS